MLIILAGLPGCGKTTIARALAQRLGVVHVRIDTIEQALRRFGMLKDDVGPAGYLVGYAVAEENLKLGRIVVADSVNPLKVTREAWRAVAERAVSKAIDIEVICSDMAEHRRRVETRQADIEGLQQPTWQDVVDRRYDEWDRGPVIVDTAFVDANDIVADIADRLGLSSALEAL